MPETTPERFTRLLALVALLADGEGHLVADVAQHFGVGENQIYEDVDLLWLSGAPGYWPNDMIDFDADAIERGVIRLTQDQGIGRPLRLSVTEAAALLASLQAIKGEESLVEEALVDQALAKLSAAAGGALDRAAITVDLARQAPPAAMAPVREALAGSRRLAFRYVAADDSVSSRVVDPLGVFTDSEHWLLHAWCVAADGERYFRLDRMSDARVLAEPSQPHPGARDVDLSGFSGTGEEVRTVVLRLVGAARSIAEDLPATRIRPRPDGSVEVTLAIAEPAWLRALVLGRGGDIDVLAPASLAQNLRRTAAQAIAAYPPELRT